MAWDDEQTSNDPVRSNDWNDMVEDQQSRIDSITVDDDGVTVVSFDDGESVSLDFTGSFSVSESENVVDIGIASGGISNTELENTDVTIAGNEVSLGGSTSIDVVDLSTTGEADTVPVSQGDGTLEMVELDDEGGFTATQSLIELEVDEMIQMSRFVAPDDTKIQVFGGSVSDENGESFAEETEVELFNHSTGETLFVIDDVNLQQGEPLFEDTIGGDELEFRLVNASSETKNLSGKMLFDILEV